MLRRKRSNAPITAKGLQSIIKKDLEDAHQTSNYQKLLILFFCFNEMIGNFTYMISAFIFMNPLFICQGEVTTEIDACQQISSCDITNSFTATHYAGLYCEKENLRSFVQSMFFIGVVAGMFTAASVSDTKGRRIALITSYCIQIVAILTLYTGIYFKIIPIILLGQFLAGMFIATTCVVSFVITGEFCNDLLRQRALMIYNAVWGFSEMCFFLFYNFMPEWENFLVLAILIPSVGMLIVSTFFLIETPHFCLFLAKDIKKFENSIEKVSYYDDLDMEIVVHLTAKAREYIFLQTEQHIKKEPFHKSLIKLSKNKRYLFTCICLTIIMSGYNIFYYGMQSSTERTGFNFGTSMLLMGANEFLSYVSASFFIHRIPRKKGIAIIVIIASVLGFSFMLPFVKDSHVVESIFASVIRILVVYSYSLMCLLQTESFPIELESIAIGISDGFGELGNVGVPYLVTYFNDKNMHPAIISSVFFFIFGLIPLAFIKETRIPEMKVVEEKKEVEEVKVKVEEEVIRESLISSETKLDSD